MNGVKNNSYYKKIEAIVATLEIESNTDPELLDKVQERLDKLAINYQDSESLGVDRYALYYAQSLIHLRRGNTIEADKWMQEAKALKTMSSEVYNEANAKWGSKPNKRKAISIIVWQFVVTFVIGAGLSAMANQVTGLIISTIIFVIWVIELIQVLIGRNSLLDKVFSTELGKILFWEFFIIYIILLVYVPQKWGEWTNDYSSTTNTPTNVTITDSWSSQSYQPLYDNCIDMNRQNLLDLGYENAVVTNMCECSVSELKTQYIGVADFNKRATDSSVEEVWIDCAKKSGVEFN
jgi:hypothetical protein